MILSFWSFVIHYSSSLLLSTLQTEVKIDEEKHRLGIVETAPDRDQIISNARRRFRLNAKQGIEYLVETGFFAMKGTPEEVARFMYEVGESEYGYCNMNFY
jgi:hypothetical protein